MVTNSRAHTMQASQTAQFIRFTLPPANLIPGVGIQSLPLH